MIHIYTDGSSRGNPGPGGYGTLLVSNGRKKELTGGFRRTTNNRMELLAAIVGLEALKKPSQQVTVHTDSKYVADAINKGWLRSWLRTGFKGKKNPDLWQRFWQVFQQHDVTMQWVKGHAGHPENERCDALATQSAQGPHLGIDQGYEQQPHS